MNHISFIFSQLSRLNAIFIYVIASLCLLSTPAQAINFGSLSEQKTEFLPVDQAFKFNFIQSENTLTLEWEIEDGYYLYKDRTKAKTTTNELTIEFDRPGVEKYDEYFGLVAVYKHQLSATIDITGVTEDTILLTYQGCAEAGLCYPPKLIDVPLLSLLDNTKTQNVNTSANANVDSNLAKAATTSALSSGLSEKSPPATEDSNLANQYFNKTSLWLTLISFLILGIGLSMTPCVLPMVPILSTIVVGQQKADPNNRSTKKGIFLSIAYVLGMATFYTLSGVLVGYFGASFNLQLYLQNPTVVIIFATIFVALAFAMFGFYELALPASVQSKLQNAGSGSSNKGLFATYLAGGISALALSPCVSAPLASALVYISTTGDALLGGTALFVMSIGMGLPLILVGAGFGGYLPQTGAWMIRIKQLFGVMMLGMAIWMLRFLLDPLVIAGLILLLAIWVAVHLGLLSTYAVSETNETTSKNKQALALTILIGGIGWFTHTYMATQLNAVNFNGNGNQAAESALVQRIKSVALLEETIASQTNKNVVVDLYADWCVSCQTIEHEVFAKIDGKDYPNHIFLQLDLTDMTTAKQDFLTKHGLFGPPALLIFKNIDNEVSRRFIFQAEFNLTQFQRWLKTYH